MIEYTENFDPGFSELQLDDFVEETVDDVKLAIIDEIEAEFIRLGVGREHREELCYFQMGTTKFEMIPAFNLAMFRDYLKRLVGSDRPTMQEPQPLPALPELESPQFSLDS